MPPDVSAPGFRRTVPRLQSVAVAPTFEPSLGLLHYAPNSWFKAFAQLLDADPLPRERVPGVRDVPGREQILQRSSKRSSELPILTSPL